MEPKLFEKLKEDLLELRRKDYFRYYNRKQQEQEPYADSVQLKPRSRTEPCDDCGEIVIDRRCDIRIKYSNKEMIKKCLVCNKKIPIDKLSDK